MENIVLDTNCLIAAIKRDSRYYPIWHDFLAGKYCLCVTDDILNEYEEIIAQKTQSQEIAHSIINAILNRNNTRFVQVFYHFHLIQADNDDNKFVDCAIKTNAKFIVSNDRHLSVLKDIDFPHVDVVDIEQFLEILSTY